MTTKTQARAPARALVGAALFGSAMGLVAITAQFAETPASHQPQATLLNEAGSRGSIDDSRAGEHRARPRLVKASLLPEIPAPLLTPTPSLAFRAPRVEASERDVECLTRAVYFESRGDTDVGQAAVAQVVLNRARHPLFPKTVCGVVNQGVERRSCQFSFACKPTKVTDQRQWRRARSVAEKALGGHTVDAVGTSTFFHAARVNPGWKLTRVGQFGAHIFYKYPGKKGAPSSFASTPRPSLFEQFAAPIQAALARPAVETVAAPPEPILALPMLQPVLTAVATPSIPAAQPVKADTAVAHPAPVQAATPAPELVPIANTPLLPALVNPSAS